MEQIPRCIGLLSSGLAMASIGEWWAMYSGTCWVCHVLIGWAMWHTCSVRLALRTSAFTVELLIGCEINYRLIELGYNGSGFGNGK